MTTRKTTAKETGIIFERIITLKSKLPVMSCFPALHDSHRSVTEVKMSGMG